MDIRDFYETLDLAKIEEMIAKQQEEHLYLEFKTLSESPMNKDDKRNFAKALSGFANSSGGVVIWGIVAKAKKGKPDVASGKKPIREPTSVISQLNSFTGEFVSRIVDGVEHKIIFAGEGTEEGFIASLIPQSDALPHMAGAGLGRYYKRSGDSFYRLEHFDLEDMFGRRPKPILGLYIEKVEAAARPFEHIVGLENSGRGIAKFPYLHIEVSDPFEISKYELDGNGHAGIPRLATAVLKPYQRTYGGTSDIVVYPNNRLAVTRIRPKQIDFPLPKVTLVADYEIFCEGVQSVSGKLRRELNR